MSASGSILKTAKSLLLLLPLLFASGTEAAPKVHLDITKEAGRKMSLAVMPFQAGDYGSQPDPGRLLERDLLLSGLFELLPIGDLERDLFALEDESGKIQYPSWTSWGVELLLKATIAGEGNSIVIQSTLYEIGEKKPLLGREYRGSKDQLVRVIHTLVDDVVKTLTGSRGISLTRIALAWADKGPKRISIMDYDGRGTRPISPEGVLSLFPAWFPDGSRLAYVTYRFGRPEIVIHELRTGRIRSLAFFPGMNAFPAISPNGKSILLSLSRDGNPEIYRMEVNGSALKRLTFTKAVEASPVWSPDMQRIAFVSDRTGTPQIYTSSSHGGRARRISYTGHYSTSPDWSPKGERIVFTSLTEGTFQLFLVDMESGQNEQLTVDRGNKEDPSWAPDGRHLIYSQGRGTTYRLVILDTFTGEKFPIIPKSGSYSSPAWSP